MSGGPAPETSGNSGGGRRRLSVGDVRMVAIVAVGGLMISTLATMALAIGKTASLVKKTVKGGWNEDLIVVSVLEAVDTYLLAVVQLIVVIGLFELFVRDIDVPDWLEIKSLDDLKKPIIDVLVVFVSIKAIERFIVSDRPLDSLYSVTAAAALILSLTLFRTMTATRGRKGG